MTKVKKLFSLLDVRILDQYTRNIRQIFKGKSNPTTPLLQMTVAYWMSKFVLEVSKKMALNICPRACMPLCAFQGFIESDGIHNINP